MEKKGIKINLSGFTADINLPGGLYCATIKALKFAIKNKFSRDEDEVYFAKETLEIMQEAIKLPLTKLKD